jgi:glutaredoxin 3
MAAAILAEVTIYTSAYCGYCHAAKRLLEKKGVSLREIDVDRRPDLCDWLEEATEQQTVPQIFINGRPIGGYSELSSLARDGRLEGMLATPPPVDKPALRS